MLICVCFFFFKQKTAYEIRLSLVGSEMCIETDINPAELTKKIAIVTITSVTGEIIIQE